MQWQLLRLFVICLVTPPCHVAAEAPVKPVPLQLSSRSVPLNSGKTVKELPKGLPGAPVAFSWLGCLELQPASGAEHVFGGVSGAYVHGSRMLLVSDTARLPRPPWWGSGRLFAADLRLAPAASVPGAPSVLPVAVENVTEQPLRDSHGNVEADEVSADIETLDVDWSHQQAVVGLEFGHAVRSYHFLTPPDSSTGNVILSVPVALGQRQRTLGIRSRSDGGYDPITKVGLPLATELEKCGNRGDNLGAVTISLTSDGRLAAFCESAAPEDQQKGVTTAWLADRQTGSIRARYMVELPPVEDIAGDFFRISGVAALPLLPSQPRGAARLLLLFHYWHKHAGHMIKLALALMGPDGGVVRPEVALELRAADGFPVDDFQALAATPVPGIPSGHAIHLLSDNNFSPHRQSRTLMMSLFMQDKVLLPRVGIFNAAQDPTAAPTSPVTSSTTTPMPTSTTTTCATTVSTTLVLSTSTPATSTTTANTRAVVLTSAQEITARPGLDAITYRKQHQIGCGDCSGNDVNIGKGYLRYDDVSREEAFAKCSTTCGKSKDCGGFSFVAFQSRCYYRKVTACNVFSNSGFDCYTKERQRQTSSTTSPPVPTPQALERQDPTEVVVLVGQYFKRSNVGCGDCGDNDLNIGQNFTRFDFTSRWTSLEICGAVCDTAAECAGFTFVAYQHKCYYRKKITCNVFTSQAFDCYAKAQKPEHQSFFQSPSIAKYRMLGGTGCGDCQDNDVHIGVGGNRFDHASRETALAVCGNACDTSEQCMGFNYVTAQRRCYYRKRTSCNLFPHEQFDCYTKASSPNPPSINFQAKFSASQSTRPTFMLTPGWRRMPHILPLTLILVLASVLTVAVLALAALRRDWRQNDAMRCLHRRVKVEQPAGEE